MLQEFGENNFPLQKYIVNVDKGISRPSYLANDSTYTISNGLPSGSATKTLVKISNDNEWPSHTDLNFDESQYDAYRAALTKQMVVIQGPPGIFYLVKFDFSSVCLSFSFIF